MYFWQKQPTSTIKRNAILAVMAAAFLNFKTKYNVEHNGSDVFSNINVNEVLDIVSAAYFSIERNAFLFIMETGLMSTKM